MKTLIVAALLLTSASVLADNVKVCTSRSNIAAGLMEARQNGAPMAELLAVPAPEHLKAVIKKIIVSAYKQPRFNGDDFQQKAILDFSNKVMVECMESDQRQYYK